MWLPPLWESREHLSCTWSKCHMFFSDSSSPKLPALCRDVVGSSTSRTQSGTSCGGGYGSLGHVFLSLDARRSIYVARHVMCATYILKYAQCADMRGLRFTLEIEGCRRSHMAATTEDNPRTLVVPMERGSHRHFLIFHLRRFARCCHVVGFNAQHTRWNIVQQLL